MLHTIVVMFIFLWYRWGCQHEKDAIDAFSRIATSSHTNLQVSSSGFCISSKYPFIGASPDGIVTCNCCRKRVLEVKCPFSCKSNLPDEEKENFFMTKENGNWTLKRNHLYYFQVQIQMEVCKVLQCEFVVWTEGGVSVESIPVDTEFLESVIEHVTGFFKYGILPEIVGKWYTRKPIADSQGVVQLPSSHDQEESTSEETESETNELWCYCQQPGYGEMIMCDNPECTIRWFHFDCLRIRRPPKGKWYCPSCHKLPSLNRRNKKKPHTHTELANFFSFVIRTFLNFKLIKCQAYCKTTV